MICEFVIFEQDNKRFVNFIGIFLSFWHCCIVEMACATKLVMNIGLDVGVYTGISIKMCRNWKYNTYRIPNPYKFFQYIYSICYRYFYSVYFIKSKFQFQYDFTEWTSLIEWDIIRFFIFLIKLILLLVWIGSTDDPTNLIKLNYIFHIK